MSGSRPLFGWVVRVKYAVNVRSHNYVHTLTLERASRGVETAGGNTLDDSITTPASKYVCIRIQ